MSTANPPNASHLLSLPHEIQTQIYKYIYVRSDITIRPHNYPHTLSASELFQFSILGLPSPSLLLTCRAMHKVTHPLYQSVFSGRVNFLHPRTLAYSNAFIRANARVLRIIFPIPGSRSLYQMSDAGFGVLGRVEIFVDGPTSSFSDERAGGLAVLDGLVGELGSGAALFVENARRFYAAVLKVQWARTYRLDRDDPGTVRWLELFVYQRYMGRDPFDETKEAVLGVVVRFCKGEGEVVSKVYLDSEQCMFWDDSDDEPASPGVQHGHLHLVKGRKVILPADDVPSRFCWVKPGRNKLLFEDLDH